MRVSGQGSLDSTDKGLEEDLSGRLSVISFVRG